MSVHPPTTGVAPLGPNDSTRSQTRPAVTELIKKHPRDRHDSGHRPRDVAHLREARHSSVSRARFPSDTTLHSPSGMPSKINQTNPVKSAGFGTGLSLFTWGKVLRSWFSPPAEVEGLAPKSRINRRLGDGDESETGDELIEGHRARDHGSLGHVAVRRLAFDEADNRHRAGCPGATKVEGTFNPNSWLIAQIRGDNVETASSC